MKDHDRSLLQGLTGMLASSARQLFRDASRPADRPAAGTGNTPELADNARAMDKRQQAFSSEMFAELLIELPDFQKKISLAWQTNDRHSLRSHLHQLLGAVAYCDVPELETALRKFHQAIKIETADAPESIDACYTHAFNAINSTLQYSGHGGG